MKIKHTITGMFYRFKVSQLLLVTLAAIIFVFPIVTAAQCVAVENDPCISIRQSTLDKAAKIVDELKAAREAVAAFEKERVFTDAERKAWLAFRESADFAVAMLQKGTADRDKVIEASMKVIDKLMAVNERLLTQLDKKPSAWKQFVNVLKSAVLLITGAAIRGSL